MLVLEHELLDEGRVCKLESRNLHLRILAERLLRAVLKNLAFKLPREVSLMGLFPYLHQVSHLVVEGVFVFGVLNVIEVLRRLAEVVT